MTVRINKRRARMTLIASMIISIVLAFGCLIPTVWGYQNVPEAQTKLNFAQEAAAIRDYPRYAMMLNASLFSSLEGSYRLLIAGPLYRGSLIMFNTGNQRGGLELCQVAVEVMGRFEENARKQCTDMKATIRSCLLQCDAGCAAQGFACTP
jgi:hypothetical protein